MKNWLRPTGLTSKNVDSIIKDSYSRMKLKTLRLWTLLKGGMADLQAVKGQLSSFQESS